MVGAMLTACQDQSTPVDPGQTAKSGSYDAAPGPRIPWTNLLLAPNTSRVVSGKKVLLLHHDVEDGSSASALRDNLVATGLFAAEDITAMLMAAVPPSLETLMQYDAVIVWTRIAPVPAVAEHGDRLKEYVDAGGGVLIMTYAYSSPDDSWELQGGIMQDGYSPLDLSTTRQSFAAGDRTLNFTTAATAHPFLNGVTEFSYGGNENYVDLTLDPGATLIAEDNTGKPLIAVNEAGTVGGINLYPGPVFTKSAGVFLTIANATVSVADALTTEPEGENTETVGENGGTVTVEEDGDGNGTSSPVVGIEIPPGTFTEDVEVTVRVVEVTPEQPCHDFLIQQTGKCVEITAETSPGVAATLNNNVIVGVCLPADAHIEIYKWDDPQGRAIPLRQVSATFLNCSDAEFASAQPRNWLEGLAMNVSKRVGRWISPKLAYAADRGFGGEVLADGGLSTFTWAAPVALVRSGLAINVFNSGKDAFGVEGIFSLVGKDDDPFIGEAGFDPTSANADANTVTVAYGDHVETIPNASWRFVRRTQRWTYVSSTAVGVNYMDIDPVTGEFRVAGRTLTKGDALPTGRPFTIQIGHRIRGHFLECAANGSCTGAHGGT